MNKIKRLFAVATGILALGLLGIGAANADVVDDIRARG